jgi:O-antigen/teichoic acid export membrane protein
MKWAAALLLGVLSFAVFMFVAHAVDSLLGETTGAIVIGIVMLAYFFICQFRLSRGNPNALFKDWPMMLALNVTMIVALVVSVLVEKPGVVFLYQALGILLVCFAGTWAGAFVASRAARRRTGQR